MIRKDDWSHRVNLTHKQHDVLIEFGKVASPWEYETFSGKWHIDMFWCGYRIRLTYIDQKMEWWAFRDCYMKRDCEKILRKETPLEDIRRMANVGRWSFDLETELLLMEDEPYGSG